MTRIRIVIAALALAALALVAAALTRPWEVAAPGPGEGGSPPAASDFGAVVTELDEGTWWRIGWRPLDEVVEPPDFERLTIGRMSGEIIGNIQLGANGSAGLGAGGPFVAGPVRGLILYTNRVGDLTELHLVDTGAGADRMLVSTGAVLHHADLAPRSGFAFFVTGPRNPGVWRVALDGTGEPELVASPPELARVAGPVLATAPIDQLPTQVTIRVDPEEAQLAVLTCSLTCVLRVIDLATGVGVAVEDVDPGFREITDFVDGTVVISGISGYDVETGLPAPIPDGARVNVQPDAGWEVPPGWNIEQRNVHPDAQVVGMTWFVAIGPDGEEMPIEAMGQGIGQG
jgi:hypothetical protein